MPETELTIQGECDSNLITFQQSSQTITYTEDYEQDQIQFVVTGKKSTDANESSSAEISWKLSGTNELAYSPPNDITITIIDPPVGQPELTIPQPEGQVGKMSIFATCSHPGTIYYIVSQDENKTQITYNDIKSASQDKYISQTEIGTIYNNPTRSIYGFIAAPASTPNEIIFEENLQSQAKYYLRAYCVNLIDSCSEPSDVQWTQPSNGGKPLIAKFLFGNNVTNSTNSTSFKFSPLKESQRRKIACLICQYTENEKDRVFGKGAISCQPLAESMQDSGQDESQSQGSSTSNSTTEDNNSTRFLSPIPSIQSTQYRLLETLSTPSTSFENQEYFVIMPNLFRALSDLTSSKQILEGADFEQALLQSNILEGLNISSITCSISTDYPIKPTIEPPILVSSEQQISFTWTGANNTDGFLFVGVAPQANTSDTPTVTQIKKESGFGLTGSAAGYYSKNANTTLIVTPLSQCLDYRYFWVATNQDPETYQYQTEIYQGTTTTLGCSKNSSIIKFNIIIALVMLLIIRFI